MEAKTKTTSSKIPVSRAAKAQTIKSRIVDRPASHGEPIYQDGKEHGAQTATVIEEAAGN